MNIFHFKAFALSAWKSRFQTTNLHIFGLVGKVLARRWFLLHFWPWIGTVACARSKRSRLYRLEICCFILHVLCHRWRTAQARNESHRVAQCAQHDFQEPSKTRAKKKVAIKQLLFAANQVVFPLWIWPKGYKVINIIFSFLSSQNSGAKRPIFTYLGSLKRPWPVDGRCRFLAMKSELWTMACKNKNKT
jgi:hypothetical protein